ncbi:MAG: O-antigen ligase family protein [Candidatus Sericytochromatia bacterium]
MKYLIFFCMLLSGPPLLAVLLTRQRALRSAVLPLLVLLTVKTQDINFVSMEWYRGTAKGFEISLVDLLALGMLGALWLERRRFKLTPWPPGSTLFWLYFACSALSVVNAAEPVFVGFELFKMLRMYLLFWVFSHWIQHPRELQWFLRGIAVAMLYIFYEMLNQKYRLGMWQAKGPFPHQNSLVMYVNLFNCLLFSYVLNQKRAQVLNSLFWLGLLGVGMLCTVFTFSRGGLMFLALGLGLVFAFSYTPGQISLRKTAMLMLALLACGAIGWKASDSISERFETAPEESMEVRQVLAIAALRMVADKPLGVGLNQFGLKINPPYPYGDHIPRKEVRSEDEEEEKGGLVETVYLMIAAECGWHSLGLYLLLLWGFCFRAFRLFFKARDPVYKSLALGLAAGLSATYLESCFEWVLKQSNNFYQLMLIFGLILALERLEQRRRSVRKIPRRHRATPDRPVTLARVG